MNLNKTNWQPKNIGDVAAEKSFRVDKPSESSYEKFVGLEHFVSGDYKIKNWKSTDDVNSAMKLFGKGDLLFARRNAYLKRASIADFNGVCSGDAIVIEQNDLLEKDFLILLFNSSKFWEYANSNAAGTMSKRVKWRDLAKYNFNLPPKEDQKIILDTLFALESQIEETKVQEGNLRRLAKKIIDEFIDNNQFGDLLKPEQLVECKWKDCVDKLLRRTDPVEDGIERIVAGENLESQDFKIRTWGTVGQDFLGPAFHVMFEPGDILFGSRRTYLRKVSFADFKGVCANTTFVVKSKEDILLQDLLKHIMLSERFIQYSIAKSKGSTNPYINWKDLNDFKFKLPDLDTQRKMADILDDCIANAEIAREQSITLKKLKHKLLDEIFD
jgi:restriction endonuclease S subunit